MRAALVTQKNSLAFQESDSASAQGWAVSLFAAFEDVF
jgi:hypothetical protein